MSSTNDIEQLIQKLEKAVRMYNGPFATRVAFNKWKIDNSKDLDEATIKQLQAEVDQDMIMQGAIDEVLSDIEVIKKKVDRFHTILSSEQ